MAVTPVNNNDCLSVPSGKYCSHFTDKETEAEREREMEEGRDRQEQRHIEQRMQAC